MSILPYTADFYILLWGRISHLKSQAALFAQSDSQYSISRSASLLATVDILEKQYGRLSYVDLSRVQ